LSLDRYVLEFADVNTDNHDHCGCDIDACKYTVYRSTVTAHPIPETEIQYKLNSWKNRSEFRRFVDYTAQNLTQNMAKVDLFFGSSSITDVEEVVAYDFDDLLGDIGGVMGLFLGASIFTTMEFVTLLLNILSTVYIWKIRPILNPDIRNRTIITETNF
jgi:hypothetical protein